MAGAKRRTASGWQYAAPMAQARSVCAIVAGQARYQASPAPAWFGSCFSHN